MSILFASIVATVAMTIFSYIISWWSRKNYSEPYWLAQLIYKPVFGTTSLSFILGWLTHFLIGYLFAVIWIKSPLIDASQDWRYLIVGAFFGCLGIFSWILIFLFSQKNDKSFIIPYCCQLFFAHLVYGITLINFI
ncbi:hypothetical protein HX109_15185 [Galbibacter sp. BG1]|uniref:hypothetical protein n=1 Tax=Galbibacter sp. BG1 TaxID=1170699 RepID=UPI0015C00DBD|nr:hypothetical protein [Galbibacter sp. BG1]QLE02843.1 hypothetical protein HX109_15185 [Galbibacter sp. BG1]